MLSMMLLLDETVISHTVSFPRPVKSANNWSLMVFFWIKGEGGEVEGLIQTGPKRV